MTSVTDKYRYQFYCDPPYWDTEGYGVPFELDQYTALAEKARTIQGTMIISVNDHPAMREAFAGLPYRTVEINYTVGGSGRGGGQRELIISNRGRAP